MMTKNLAQIWAEMLAALSASFEGRSWKIWLDAAHPRTLEENTLSLDVPNDFTKNTLQEKYLPIMEESLSQICGKPMKVQIDVVETAKEGPSLFPDAPAQPAPEPAAVQPEPQPAAKPAQEFDSHLSPKYTFDNFIRGKSNEEAFNFSMGVANAPAKSYNPLFLYSDPGLGKTHLMNAIGNYIHKKFPQMKILYTSSETFTNELIGAIQHNTNEAFRNKYRNIDVLLIDDIQFLRKKESTQEEFFHTFNSLHDAHKQIVIASDRPAKEIKSLEERLRTRFEWGLTADVQPPDFETRVAIVKRKAELLHLDLPEDVAEFIANHLKNNIRQLEGAVKKLNAYYMLEGIQPVISVAQNAIKDILNETQPVPVTIEKIIGEVSRTFNVSPADIRGTKRNANVASARRVAIYILREVTGMSMEEIGREFSGRDHSTIVYSLKTMERDMKNDQHLRETVSDIIKNVKA